MCPRGPAGEGQCNREAAAPGGVPPERLSWSIHDVHVRVITNRGQLLRALTLDPGVRGTTGPTVTRTSHWWME